MTWSREFKLISRKCWGLSPSFKPLDSRETRHWQVAEWEVLYSEGVGTGLITPLGLGAFPRHLPVWSSTSRILNQKFRTQLMNVACHKTSPALWLSALSGISSSGTALVVAAQNFWLCQFSVNEQSSALCARVLLSPSSASEEVKKGI